MKVLNLELKRCDDCPYCLFDDFSNEEIEYYMCNQMKSGSNILMYAGDWFKKNEIPIPSWCPLPDKDKA